MKKGLLLLLLSALALHSYTQNWVEVGVDTQYGSKFLPNDLVHLDNQQIILSGHSYNPTVQYSAIKNGFFTSSDSGHTWDTLRYFNSCVFDGANYRVAKYDTFLFVIEGGYSINQPPIQNPNLPACEGYELNLYNNRFQKVKSIFRNYELARYKWLGDVTPISSNTALLSMLDVLGLNDGSGRVPHFYIERLNVNTLAMDSIPLPVRMENVYKIHFIDSLRGYLVGGSVYQQAGGYLLYTQDGGRNWMVMREATTGQYNDVAFYNNRSGILAGDEDIYFTGNAGFDWYPSSGTPSRFKAIDIATAGNDNSYAIGYYTEYVNGQAQSSVQIYKSLDKGHSWCLVFEDTSEFYYNHEHKSMHISFSNENRGVAAYGYNRLIYTENGGGLTECVTGINEIDELAFSIYPNPNQGSFTINMPSNEAFTVEVFDLSGKPVYLGNSPGGTIQLDGLEPGMYIVSIRGQQQVATQKVVVTE